MRHARRSRWIPLHCVRERPGELLHVDVKKLGDATPMSVQINDVSRDPS